MPLPLIRRECVEISFLLVSRRSRVMVVLSCRVWATLVQVLSLARVAIVSLVRRTLRVLVAASAARVMALVARVVKVEVGKSVETKIASV